MNNYDIELTCADYWHTKKECFVITLGENWSISQTARVKDHDGVIWDCYCAGVKYYPKSNMYEVMYKTF